MDIWVLDQQLNPIMVIDTYESFIWTDRYCDYGDFELYAPVSPEMLSIRQGDYICTKESEHAMIVEKIVIESDAEDGDYVTITGRSLESILERRIIWGQRVFKGSFQDGIKYFLDDCIINPSDPDRKIPNFIFQKTEDKTITDLTLNVQCTGDNLGDVIYSLCQQHLLGYKVTLNSSKQFVFTLYSGADRSYDQDRVPYVVFSPNFDNILSSKYVDDVTDIRTVTLVAGEGEGSARKSLAVGMGSGLDRHELYTDARDISSDVDGGTMSDDDYSKLLLQRGLRDLLEHTCVPTFDGQADTTQTFKYREDFFIGDIVQISDLYGHNGKAMVTEIVISDDRNGTKVYPTFETV